MIGRDYGEVIEQFIGRCDVQLVVIGPDWVGERGSAGPPRLHDAHDLVRLEVRSALERKIPVVPVLVDGAALPSQAQLPTDLGPLTRRNAVELRHTRWDDDADHLMDALERIVSVGRPPDEVVSATAPRSSRRFLMAGPVAVAAGLAALIGTAVLLYELESQSPDPVQKRPAEAPKAAAEPTPSRDARISMPNLVGLDVRSAMATVERSGLEVTGRRSEATSSARPYTVIRQEPARGTLVERGSPVTFVYAVAPSSEPTS